MSKQAGQGQTGRRDEPVPIADLEKAISSEMARANRSLGGTATVLSHLLFDTGPSLISDAVVARLRGMLASLARQLIAAKGNYPVQAESETSEVDQLVESLSSNSVILSWCFAQAIEGTISEQLERRVGIDPVMSPLLRELLGAADPALRELANGALAAQARFIDGQRRMSMSLIDLPGEIFDAVIKQWEEAAKGDRTAKKAVGELKDRLDEGIGRSALLAQLVGAIKQNKKAVLDIDFAGFALFATVLAHRCGQLRELVIFSCHEGQLTRLALSLRAAGLGLHAIEKQLLAFDPSAAPPAAIAALAPRRAAAILAGTSEEVLV